MKNFKIKKLFLFLFVLLIPSAVFSEELKLRSFGHSNFLIQGGGKKIIINPFKSVGCASHLKENDFNGNLDFILASSRLADEGYNPQNKLMFVDPGTYSYKNIMLQGISVPHDRFLGRRFGMATVWVWEQSDFKIVHMAGAAGMIDFEDQIFLSRPDILFISIGGGDKSYNGIEATKIINKLKPRNIIPVHFLKEKRSNDKCQFSNEDIFVNNVKDFKVKYVKSSITINQNNVDKKTIYIFR